MRRTIWIAWLLLFLLWMPKVAPAQDSNSQTNYTSAVFYQQPSIYVNFDDPSNNFLDLISQQNFVSTISRGSSTVGGFPLSPTNTGGNPRVYMMMGDFVGDGTVSTLSLQFQTAPTAGATYALAVATDNGSGNYTITSYPGSVTVAATTAVQTFTSGAGLPVFTANAGQTVGIFVTTGQTSIGYATGTVNYWGITASAFPSIGVPTAYSHSGLQVAFSATMNSSSVTSPGTTTPHKPGFDNTQANNTSAAFTYNAWNAAPNATLGAIDWNVPYTLMIHVDRLNWNRSGTLVLASKGDIGSTYGPSWELYLQMHNTYSQLCFERTGGGSSPPTVGASSKAQNGTCTASTFDAMPNGFNYNIVVTDTGTGASAPSCGGCTSPLTLYINGLAMGSPFTNSYTNGQGYAALTIASGGTGYTVNTAFTSTGGGPNCTVSGTATESGGALTGIASTVADYGCTSNPIIVLTAPTGTGASITAFAQTTTINDATLPLLVPGYVSSNYFYGVDAADSTQTSTYVDEFAIFPGVLSQTAIQSIFYQTKFYQQVDDLSTTPPQILVLDDDAGGDLDNFLALQMVIAAHQRDLVHLAGVVIEDQSVTCEATERQMLDQAGLNDIPLAVPPTFVNNSGTSMCPTANVNAFNASTPLSNAAWEASTTMYRTVFAEYPTTPINIVLGGPFTAMAAFMASPADGISSLTGLQLMAQNAANGGAIYAQGLGCTTSAYPASTPCSGTFTGDNSLADPAAGQYVVTNNGATPIYFIGGVPQNAGPGVLSTHTYNDPMYLLANFLGTDTRQCYDCLPVEASISSYFTGGVTVGYSGGTSYANSTPFTFSGGGAKCTGIRIMTASGGVPNGIQFQWGASAVSSYTGIGNGCTSAPTINLAGSTGTGVTLTGYPRSVCGTYTITYSGGVWWGTTTSATCSNHYFQPYSVYANQTAVSGAPMSWLANSLIDPTPTGAPKVQQ